MQETLEIDTDDTIKLFRNRWQLLIATVDNTVGIEEMRFKLGNIEHTVDNGSTLDTTIKLRKVGDKGQIKWINFLADMKISLHGYTGSTEIGGCSKLGGLWFMPGYIPPNMNSSDPAVQLSMIKDFMYSLSDTAARLNFDYSLRIKNLAAINFVQQCDVPTDL